MRPPWMKPHVSKEGKENHLQRTASCSWSILQGLHHTALLPDKKQNHPFTDGQYLAVPDRYMIWGSSFSGGYYFPGPALEFLHLPSSCASSTPCSTSASLCTPKQGKQVPLSPSPHGSHWSTLALTSQHMGPSLPTHLFFFFWGHMVGGCFDALQSLCVASTFLLQLLELFLHLRCGQGTR